MKKMNPIRSLLLAAVLATFVFAFTFPAAVFAEPTSDDVTKEVLDLNGNVVDEDDAEDADDAALTTGTAAEDADDAEEAHPLLPAARQKQLVEDEADLLTDAEEASLLEKLEEISARHNCDVAVVTVDELDGKSATAFADDYYDYNGYGYGDNHDGILLLVSMAQRDWAISTTGSAIEAFTDKGLQYMADEFLPYLSNGNYLAGFESYAELCDQFLTQAENGEPYDVHNMPGEGEHEMPGAAETAGMGALAFAGASAVTGLSRRRKLAQMKPVRRQMRADSYVKEDGVDIHSRGEHFLHNHVVATPIQRDHDDHDGGGSSTHFGSSGVSHGGASGKF